jgi:tRNA A64-2'-O-ribosylphosphate transferase
LPLPDLALPLRPVHVSPADPLPALAPAATLGFYPIVCLSASRFIASDDDRQMRGETLEDGSTTEPWRYEQGAGDDHELWSAGLTPADFWHKLPAGWERSAKAEVEQLAKAATKGPDSKPGLPSIAAALAEDSSRELATPNANTIDLVRPSAFVHLATLPLSSTTLDDYACIILSSSVGLPCPIFPEPSSSQRRAASDDDLGRPARHDQTLLVLPTKPPKAALPPPAALETAVAFAACSIARGQKVVVACEGGTDGSVGVGVVLLQALFDEKGIFRAEPSASSSHRSSTDLSQGDRSPVN